MAVVNHSIGVAPLVSFQSSCRYWPGMMVVCAMCYAAVKSPKWSEVAVYRSEKIGFSELRVKSFWCVQVGLYNCGRECLTTVGVVGTYVKLW